MARSPDCPHCGKAVPSGARFCQACGKQITAGRTGPKWGTIAAIALILLVGVGIATWRVATPSGEGPARTGEAKSQERPTRIDGAGQMPMWLLNSDPTVQDDYVWAAANLDVLQYMPCYCGCGSVGHSDNFSCYFKRDENGLIQGYDNHATG